MKFEPKELPALALEGLSRIRRYAIVLFLLLVAAVYGFLLLHIGNLHNVQPGSVDSSQQTTAAATPHIDPKLVKQLQQLQDNSVNVKTLFDQARSNPFLE
jgi:hypothetical protein